MQCYFIPTKFHQNPSSGSGKEVKNVKVYRRRTSFFKGARKSDPLGGITVNLYPAAKVYTTTSAISTAAKVSVNKCSTKDAHIPPLSPYSIFILMFTIINIVWNWKLKSKA